MSNLSPEIIRLLLVLAATSQHISSRGAYCNTRK